MSFSLSDITFLIRLLLDILVVWGLIYSGLRIVRNNSRTIQLVKGVLIIVLIKALAVWLGLNALNYLIEMFLNWGVVVILVVFQPEIRGMLEKVGKTTAILTTDVSVSQIQQMINELVEACTEMSKSKTGALISIERTQSLSDFIRTGIVMDSEVSTELLGTIFQYGTPMHDGAVIIQGNKIACAAAYFPPTTKDLPSKYGARHRAAVGISEITDSITIIVSEETGNISVAVNGQLTQYPPEGLQRYLTNMLVTESSQNPSSILVPMLSQAKSMGKRAKKQTEDANKDERVKAIEIVNLYEQKRGQVNMESPNKKSPSVWFNELRGLLTLIFQKVSKLVDRVLFDKKGSVIISLVLSIMICVVINYEDISLKLFNDTRTTVDLRNVAVEVLADTDKYDVAGVPSTVDVSLTGDATSIQVFRSKGSVQVVADLKKYSEGENIINLKVKNLPEKIEAVVDPATIDVTLSKKVTKSFTIQPELLVGSNQKVTDFETPTLDVMTVKITASQNQLNSIRIVKALIDCTGQIQDFEANAALAAYDAKGNRVNVTLSPETVHASVKLAKNTSLDKEDSE